MIIKRRETGVLLHISSLYSEGGIGTLGREAYRFVDILSDCGFTIWQTLPIAPTGFGNSPYQSPCSTALNYNFIDFKCLARQGLLNRTEFKSFDFGRGDVDYEKLIPAKIACLRLIFEKFDCAKRPFRNFVARGDYRDFSLFMTFKTRFGGRPWYEWPEEYKNRSSEAMAEAEKSDEYAFWNFTQYLFIRQWYDLKGYANAKGIKLMGDLPFYEAADSADVWAHRDLFLLDKDGRPSEVAGVPPDFFSSAGQLWGNPLYDFQAMKRDDYKWWRRRLNASLRLFDAVRIDHFRGYDRFYAIPAGSRDAAAGQWCRGPGAEIFDKSLPLVAEDLGLIDDGVRSLLAATGYPGTRVIQFAFDGDPANPHKPANYPFNCVAYSGTHDNATLKQFFTEVSGDRYGTLQSDLTGQCLSLGVERCGNTPEATARTAIELLLASGAGWVVLPMQDLLLTGGAGRMNIPATLSDRNWSYRIKPWEISDALVREIKPLVTKYRN